MKSVYRGKYASNADGISIADLHELVKQFDKDFKPNPVNPLFLNEDGSLRIMKKFISIMFPMNLLKRLKKLLELMSRATRLQ